MNAFLSFNFYRLLQRMNLFYFIYLSLSTTIYIYLIILFIFLCKFPQLVSIVVYLSFAVKHFLIIFKN